MIYYYLHSKNFPINNNINIFQLNLIVNMNFILLFIYFGLKGERRRKKDEVFKFWIECVIIFES